MANNRKRIGFDFDNTIVCYDEAIAVLSEQMFKVPPELPRTKLCLRNFLHTTGREQDWTIFQGALYGPGMLYARPFDGAIQTMHKLVELGYDLIIVSHRSRRPYAGPPHNLHVAAMDWAQQHLKSAGLFVENGPNKQNYSRINFMETIEGKLSRIEELGCQIFIDDLPEVLEAPGFPESTIGVLFAPGKEAINLQCKYCVADWIDIPGLLAQL